MQYIARIALLLVAIAVLEARSSGQQTPRSVQSGVTKGEAVLTSLSKPTFSPLARQENVEGEVIVEVTVRQDASAEATVVKGHPMLRQAASTVPCSLVSNVEPAALHLGTCLFTRSSALRRAVFAMEWERPLTWSKSRNHTTSKADHTLVSPLQRRRYVFAIMLPRSGRKCARCNVFTFGSAPHADSCCKIAITLTIPVLSVNA